MLTLTQKLKRDLIILPDSRHVTELILTNYHRAFHYSNHQTVFNEIRQLYCKTYKVIQRNCQ